MQTLDKVLIRALKKIIYVRDHSKVTSPGHQDGAK